jgi:hypothetical protein
MNGIIRKISIGDIKNGITYKKGQDMFGGTIKVIEIIKNEDYIREYGKIRYDIYIKRYDCEYIRLWKSFLDMPMAIEYDVEVEAVI